LKKSIFIIVALILIMGISNIYAQENDLTDSGDLLSSEATTADSSSEPMPNDLREAVTAAEAEEESEKVWGFWDFLLVKKYLLFLVLMAIGTTLLFIKKVNFEIRIAMMIPALMIFGLDSMSTIKIFLFILIPACLLYMILKKKMVVGAVMAIVFGIIIYLFELFIPLHPSPMCGVTKLFMFKVVMGQFFPAFIALFVAIMIPSLIGRKLFCGWVCPLGAFQELINKIPFKFKWKNFNFTAFNSVRMALLLMFFLTIYAVRDHVAYLAELVEADLTNNMWTAFSAYNVYEPINFFELLHWNIDSIFIIMMSILVLSSIVIYRPFCYLICPIGAMTWLLERIAPLRVRVDHSKCIQCGICEEKAPCPTISKLLDEKAKFIPDCTSCGECLEECEEDAISFSFVKK
jgi:Pyruvate/2-oxoacid:ferredoxin oxidoreductase delta subunit